MKYGTDNVRVIRTMTFGRGTKEDPLKDVVQVAITTNKLDEVEEAHVTMVFDRATKCCRIASPYDAKAILRHSWDSAPRARVTNMAESAQHRQYGMTGVAYLLHVQWATEEGLISYACFVMLSFNAHDYKPARCTGTVIQPDCSGLMARLIDNFGVRYLED